MTWDILGDKEAAKTWKPTVIASEPEPEIAPAKELGEEEEVHRSRPSRTTTNYYTKHPLELLIRLSQKGNVILKLTFSYYDKLNIVGVILGGEKNASLVDLPPSFVLCNLFSDEDDGSNFPNASLSLDGYFSVRHKLIGLDSRLT